MVRRFLLGIGSIGTDERYAGKHQRHVASEDDGQRQNFSPLSHCLAVFEPHV